MAQRRMFSKTITNSDLFLDMPKSTQALYFHLNMSADDDGFVGSSKMIMRMIGASDDDMRLLLAKKFIFEFDSGVVVVKDWRIHNQIRKDRHKPTIYTDEFKQLSMIESGSYERLSVGCQEVALGKDRLGKVSLGEVRLDKDNTSAFEAEKVVVDVSPPSGQNPFSFYEINGFGMLTEFYRSKISMWVDDFIEIGSTESDAEAILIKAMEISLMNNVRKWSYVESILKDWEQKMFKTIGQIEAAEVEHKANQATKQFNQSYKNVKKETLPEWAEDKNEIKEEKPMSPEEAEAFRARIARLKSSQE
ncbi:DnaD domain-containing protein [Carnobacterium maltaromaticum]|uniref:DnaD domain-containing protein n=1 Tax=Carnobacterium maltaromaticum TaxID=2751 RepID=UPI0039BDE810